MDCHCPRGTMLFDLADTVESLWFPQKGTIVSLLVPLIDGEDIETGFVGHYGVVGGSGLMDGRTALCKAIVQSGGALYIAPVDAIREVMPQHSSLLQRVVAHKQFLYAQAQQTAACNAVHRVETRSAAGCFRHGTFPRATRWILLRSLSGTFWASGARRSRLSHVTFRALASFAMREAVSSP